MVCGFDEFMRLVGFVALVSGVVMLDFDVHLWLLCLLWRDCISFADGQIRVDVIFRAAAGLMRSVAISCDALCHIALRCDALCCVALRLHK